MTATALPQLQQPATLPGPGLYRNMPADVYHALPYASNSYLQEFRRSAAHCREAIDNPSEPTPALILGDAVHYCILQPDLFETRYVIAEMCHAIKRDGKPCENSGKQLIDGHWYCGTHARGKGPRRLDDVLEKFQDQGFQITHVSEHQSHYLAHADGRLLRVSDHWPGIKGLRRLMQEGRADIRVDLPPYGDDDQRTILSEADFDKCWAMAQTVKANPAAAVMLESRSDTELTIIWNDEESGVLCKGRADLPCLSLGICGDLKTTADASDRAFRKSVENYGYYMQAAHYLDGLRAHHLEFSQFSTIAVEKEPPYAANVHTMDEEFIDCGRKLLRAYLPRFGACQRSGVWPGYKAIVGLIGPSPFMARQIEEEVSSLEPVGL